MTYNKYIFIYINLRFVGGGSRHFVLSHDLARKYSAITVLKITEMLRVLKYIKQINDFASNYH